jgi:hypothetical protein
LTDASHDAPFWSDYEDCGFSLAGERLVRHSKFRQEQAVGGIGGEGGGQRQSGT